MNSKVTPIVEGGLMAAITTILGLASVYLPVIGIVIEFFCPLPIVVLTVRQGVKAGASAVVASMFLLMIFMGPVLAVRIALMFSLCGLILGECLRRGLSAVKCFVPTLLIGFVAQIISVAMLTILLGVDVVDMNTEFLREAFDESFQIYRDIGVDPAMIANSKGYVESIVQLIAVLTPVILFLAALVNTVGTYLLAKWIFQKLQMKFAEPLPPFAQWRFPIAFMYLAAFAALGLYWGETREIAVLYFISINGIFFAGIIGLTQGLSLLSFLADKYKVSKFVRRIVFAVVILNFLFMQIVAFTGLFDMIFDYRKHLQDKK